MDGGEDPHAAAAVRAFEDVDREDPAHEIGPGEAAWSHEIAGRGWRRARDTSRSQIGVA